MKMLQKDRDF